jgi:predicted RNA binding protein YcfA (HicA-like mRNA interferase family)
LSAGARGDDRERVTRARQAAEALFTSKSPVSGPLDPASLPADQSAHKPRVLAIAPVASVRCEDAEILVIPEPQTKREISRSQFGCIRAFEIRHDDRPDRRGLRRCCQQDRTHSPQNLTAFSLPVAAQHRQLHLLSLCIGDRVARADGHRGELIDRTMAGTPVRKFLVIEALGYVRPPFAGDWPDHRAGVDLATIDAHRAAEAAAGLTRASCVLRALQRIGWVIKRQHSSHRTCHGRLARLRVCVHDGEEIGPRMLARIAKHTGLRPEDP